MLVCDDFDKYPRFYRKPDTYLGMTLEYRVRFLGARPELFLSTLGWGPSAHRDEDSLVCSCDRMSLAEAMGLCDSRALEGMTDVVK